MPTQAKVAAILLGFLAVLLLANAILGFVGLQAILDSFSDAARDRQEDFDRDAAGSQLRTLFITNAAVGAGAAVASFLLARRNRVGRLLGMACAGIQLALAALNAIGVGGILNYTLLLFVITGAILVTLLGKQTVAWLRLEPVA